MKKAAAEEQKGHKEPGHVEPRFESDDVERNAHLLVRCQQERSRLLYRRP